ncbi:zinc ribbon domain-containing protein [Vibrio zhugei]|uniref:Zinc ribbon domain-containing protein n=1 Tax=Vibrio zhugei TaxID=2479546 RepID=A0ABV7CDD9_9VIBR|nr:zinc ribbon domain-containing protein [Vibrio zhugei]
MENECPQCKQAMQWREGEYVCQVCQQHYLKHAYCPTCQSPLEKLQACGSVSYFCHTCNELKSKSAVQIAYTAVGQ